MAFHVVLSFLLRVLASKTIKQKHLIGCWKIPAIQRVVFEANTRNRKEHTTSKAMKNRTRKFYIFLCTINFEVTLPFWKMWILLIIRELCFFDICSFHIQLFSAQTEQFSVKRCFAHQIDWKLGENVRTSNSYSKQTPRHTNVKSTQVIPDTLKFLIWYPTRTLNLEGKDQFLFR